MELRRIFNIYITIFHSEFKNVGKIIHVSRMCSLAIRLIALTASKCSFPQNSLTETTAILNLLKSIT